MFARRIRFNKKALLFMKKTFKNFRDRVLLILFSLLIGAPIILFMLTDASISLKKDVLFYFFIAAISYVLLDLTMPFGQDHKLFGFRSKFPMRIGALLNSGIVILMLIVLKDRVESTPSIIKIPVLTFELILWLGVMYVIGHLIR